MQRTKRILPEGLWLLGLAAGACTFSVDADLIGRAGDDASVAALEGGTAEAGDVDAATLDAASSAEPEAATPDARPLVEPDAGAAHEGGTRPGSAVTMYPSCFTDAECGANEKCVDSLCAPRCDPTHGCAVAEFTRPPWLVVFQIINDGDDTVYYVEELDYDRPEPLDKRLRLSKLRLGSRPEVLHNDLDRLASLILATEEHVYLTSLLPEGHFGLYRMSTTGSALELLAEDTGAWHRDGYVWWQQATLDGGRELWKSPARGPLSPTRMGSARHYGWADVTSQGAVRWMAGAIDEPLMLDLLPDLRSTRTITTLSHAMISGADDQAVYLRQGNDAMRYYFDARAEPARIAPQFAELKVSSWAWVYWSVPVSDGQMLGRTHRDRPTPDGELLRLPDIHGYSALPRALVYGSDQHLYVKETPLPCDAELLCPPALSCSDGTCK